MITAERLLARTRRDGDCLIWTGALQSNGYGSVGVGTKKSALAHRVSYELHHGPIPAGLQIDHVKARGCRFRACINPAHLEAVTALENVRRSAHCQKTHCKNGHPLSGENLRWKKRGDRSVVRNCRTCQYAAQKRHYDRTRERVAS